MSCPATRHRILPRECGLAAAVVRLILLAAVLALTRAAVIAEELKTAEQGQKHSQLWGENGELWTPQSRLPDFSWAGYRWGREDYRIPQESVSVQAFGARGDDQADDTEAFKQAIDAGRGKLILIPPGRYLLSDILYLRHSGTVLRGAGPEKTYLVFTRPGVEIDPRPAKTDGNQPTTNWSWAGGLIVIGGSRPVSRDRIRVVSPQTRGDRQLRLEAHPFQPGDEILLTLRDDEEKSLLHYLYRGEPGDISGLNNWFVEQVFRVEKVEGKTLIVNRPLRFDIRPQWRPSVERFNPSLTDVGIEGITFDFPVRQYAGHFKEIGFNPVEITRFAAHCWLRNLVIRNADSGPFVSGFFCTLEKLRFEADAGRLSNLGNYTGHHGVTFGRASDCLCREFEFRTRFIHDLTVQSSIGCVFCSGRGVDVNFDHHRWAPYENLFTDIDAGAGRRLFASSGGGMRGYHSAGGTTFWGVRTAQAVRWPAHLAVHGINIVGVNILDAAEAVPTLPAPTDLTGRWCESASGHQIQPANIFEAMRQRASP